MEHNISNRIPELQSVKGTMKGGFSALTLKEMSKIQGGTTYDNGGCTNKMDCRNSNSSCTNESCGGSSNAKCHNSIVCELESEGPL